MYWLLAQIEFESAARLCGLAVLPVVAYFAWRTRVSGALWRRVAIGLCRLAGLALLVLALAGIRWRSTSDQRHVVFASDVSRSVAQQGDGSAQQFVDAALQHQGQHRVSFLAFAGRPGPVGAQPQGSPDVDQLASDPAAALRQAVASLDPDCVPQIVLLTDGNETQGSLARAAAGADVPVYTKPLPSFPAPEACLTDVIAPPLASLTGDVPIEVRVASNHAGPAKLELLGSATPLEAKNVQLQVGENTFRLRASLGERPSAVFEARLSELEGNPDNKRRRVMVFARPSLRLLLVDRDLQQAEPFRNTLASQGFQVRLQTPDKLPEAVDGLAAYDVVLLSDVPSKAMTTKQLLAVYQFVRDRGGGLLVAGGESTFGPAVYRDTALERMLPLKAAEVAETQKHSVLCMVLVIDQSKSMENENRMKLAKEAAVASVKLLDPQDKVGVMAFSDLSVWTAPISPCSNKQAVLDQIRSLEPLGQTQMYEALERAYLAMEQTDADRRHMVLLTDGVPAPGDFNELAQRIAKAGITVSTVSISKGAEQDILKDMARIARGRHHPCENPADISKILIEETRTATGDVAPREFQPFVFSVLPGLNLAQAPPLQGYAATNPKKNAKVELLLLAAGGDPLLAWWRSGAGVAVALTTEAHGKGAQKWSSWKGLGPFWKRLVRHAAPPPRADRCELNLQRTGADATATLDAFAEDGQYDSDAQVEMSVAPLDRAAQPLAAWPVAPGRFQAHFPVAPGGGYVVQAQVSGPSGEPRTIRRALLVDYPDELQLRPTNEPLLRSVAAVTGGIYDPDPAAVFAPDGRTVDRLTLLWSHFVLAALLLLVVEVALRRLRW